MFYAVAAPGFSAIYVDWHMVDRARVFYPYIKWKKFYTEEQAEDFIRKNRCSAKVDMYNYGDTFGDLYLTVTYEILSESVIYTIWTNKIGQIRIHNPDFVIEYGASKIRASLPIILGPNSIASHMSAIYNLLMLVGDYVDINLIVPNYSIFYALTYYTGHQNRSVCLVRDFISTRACKVGFTLRR